MAVMLLDERPKHNAIQRVKDIEKANLPPIRDTGRTKKTTASE